MQRPGAPARDSLRGQLMRSDSARFLDRMFCADQAFAALPAAVGRAGDGARLRLERRLRRRARRLRQARPAVRPRGRRERRVRRGARRWRRSFPTAGCSRSRSATSSARRSGCVAPLPLDPAKVRRCAAGADGRRGSNDDWEKCRGARRRRRRRRRLGPGPCALERARRRRHDGDARRGGQRPDRRAQPHLVDGAARRRSRELGAARTRGDALGSRGAGAQQIARDAAEVILSGLSYSHRAGTARLACEQVFDARTCREMDWIAGKTGTPTFPNDGRSLDELAPPLRAAAPSSARSDRSACGPLASVQVVRRGLSDRSERWRAGPRRSAC